jgi:spore coat polysaccharide biosynthesis protein SpsF (cytidylyltransferase family)
MPGHQLFPTPASEHSIEEVRWFSEAYGDLDVKVGCADHIDGDDPLAIGFPLAAIGAGAVVIEKHLTIDRDEQWEDYESALDAKQFDRFVSMVHRMNETVSYPVWTSGRQQYREKALKNFIPKYEILKGERISVDDVRFVRTEEYQDPIPCADLIQKTSFCSLTEDQIICGSHVVQEIGILLNCRTKSTRLPQKALKKICDRETIALLIERVKFSKESTNVVLCTTENPEDDILVDIAKRENIDVFRGPEENVALRLLQACNAYHLDHFVRVTGDDLLRDVPLIDEAIRSHREKNADYTCMKGVVYSCDTEIISRRALETVVERASAPDRTEYLTWFLDDASSFVVNVIQASSEYRGEYRLTLDTMEDFELLGFIYKELYQPGVPVDLKRALTLLRENPKMAAVNKHITPKLDRTAIDTSLRI